MGLGHGDYRFNNTVGIDVLEITDTAKTRYQCLNIVDMATGFQQVEVLREVNPANHGPPSAEMCLNAFQRWLSWAGLPKCIMADRGTHNRGCFIDYMTEKGVEVKFRGD